jgi:hypothetical protein
MTGGAILCYLRVKKSSNRKLIFIDPDLRMYYE